MKNIAVLIDDFLKDCGINQGAIVAGGSSNSPEVSREQMDRCMTMLETSHKQNGLLAYAVLALHVIVLLATLAYAWLHQEDQIQLAGIFSVGGILFATMISFRHFWREKTTSDILLGFLPTAKPNEALKLLLSTRDLHASQIKGKKTV